MTHGSLFSGIGGFDLAAQWCGWTNVFQVEIDKFCQKVLAKNFPNVKRYEDIKEFDGTKYTGKIDVISGGFPCQPFSVAGKRKGNEDNRALWHEMFRIICEVKPAFVVAENVPGLLSISNGMVFEQVCIDLESEGYEVQPVIIPACAKNAPHKRERIWIVAYCVSKFRGRISGQNKILPNINRNNRGEIKDGKTFSSSKIRRNNKVASDTDKQGLERGYKGNEIGNQGFKIQASGGIWKQNWYEVATEFCRMDARVSNRLDRLKALGNAIVPQIAYEIFKAIYYENKIG